MTMETRDEYDALQGPHMVAGFVAMYFQEPSTRLYISPAISRDSGSPMVAVRFDSHSYSFAFTPDQACGLAEFFARDLGKDEIFGRYPRHLAALPSLVERLLDAARTVSH